MSKKDVLPLLFLVFISLPLTIVIYGLQYGEASCLNLHNIGYYYQPSCSSSRRGYFICRIYNYFTEHFLCDIGSYNISWQGGVWFSLFILGVLYVIYFIKSSYKEKWYSIIKEELNGSLRFFGKMIVCAIFLILIGFWLLSYIE